MEKIAGLVVEQIDVLAWKVPRSFIEWNLVPTKQLDVHWKLDVSSLILYGDKCKYIDFRNIINLQVRLLFLGARLLKDKARKMA